MSGSLNIPVTLCQWSCLVVDIPVGIYVVEMTNSRSWKECVCMWLPIVPYFGDISNFSGTGEGNYFWKEMPLSATGPHFIPLPKQRHLPSPVINSKLPGYIELKPTNDSTQGGVGERGCTKTSCFLKKTHKTSAKLQQIYIPVAFPFDFAKSCLHGAL